MASRRWWRSDAALPFMLGAAVLGLVVLAWAGASLVVPGWRGAAALAVASGAFVAAFLVWPKPTLVVFALFVLYYHTLGRWLAHDLRHVDEAVVPLLFLITAWKVRPWRRGLIDAVRDGALLLMLGMGVVSSLANPVPLAVWPLALLLLAKVFAFLYVVIWHDFNPADLRQIYPLVLALAAVTLALVPFELIDPPGFRAVLNLTDFSVPREGLPSVKSVFFQPVLFGWFTAFVALFLFAAHVFLRRWWLLVAAALFSVGTLLAGRRRAIAGVVAALAGGVAVTAVRVGLRPALRAWWPSLVVAALIGLAFLPSLLGLIRLTVDETGRDLTVGQGNARIALYTTSVAIARDHFPFGVGLGRYGSALSNNPYSPVYFEYGLDQVRGLSPEDSRFVSDTFWPRILGETGAVGLVALLVFTAMLTRDVWRAARLQWPEPIAAAFVLGAWLVLAQGLVETLASSLFDAPPRSYLLFGAVGVALSLARARLSSERARLSSEPATVRAE